MKSVAFAIAVNAYGESQLVGIECPVASHFDWGSVKEVVFKLRLFNLAPPPQRVESALDLESCGLALESCGLDEDSDFEFLDNVQTAVDNAISSFDTTRPPPSPMFILPTVIGDRVWAATDDAKPTTPIELTSANVVQLTRESATINEQTQLATVDDASAAADQPAPINDDQAVAQPRVSLLDAVMRLADQPPRRRPRVLFTADDLNRSQSPSLPLPTTRLHNSRRYAPFDDEEY